jgi:phosphoribosyl 1,2-cyclic phosphodiesterase
MFIKNRPVPVFSHFDALKKLSLYEGMKRYLCEADAGDFFVEDFTVTAFGLSHDEECYGYGILNNGRKLSYLTDLGFIGNPILENIMDSDIVVIESNHDVGMVKANPKYPPYLKNRILGTRGHLSNDACRNAVLGLLNGGNVRQVVLAHLSENNNTPALAYNTMKNYLGENGFYTGEDYFLDVALQHSISRVFEV